MAEPFAREPVFRSCASRGKHCRNCSKAVWSTLSLGARLFASCSNLPACFFALAFLATKACRWFSGGGGWRRDLEYSGLVGFSWFALLLSFLADFAHLIIFGTFGTFQCFKDRPATCAKVLRHVSPSGWAVKYSRQHRTIASTTRCHWDLRTMSGLGTDTNHCLPWSQKWLSSIHQVFTFESSIHGRMSQVSEWESHYLAARPKNVLDTYFQTSLAPLRFLRMLQISA